MNIRNILIPAMCLALAACSDDDDDKNDDMMPDMMPDPVVEYEYSISTVNLTHAQPMSPISVALHTSGAFWQIGEMASTELEILAESGDASGLLGLGVVNASKAADGVLMPGTKVDLTVTTTSLAEQKLSLITMMVNTNDGFTGLNSLDVSSMAVGDSMRFTTYAYDAGTEANSEQVGTIPGPADSGEGFNAARDDIDKVAMHPGVVGMDDGLSGSVLTSVHKFDNPLLAVTISRTK